MKTYKVTVDKDGTTRWYLKNKLHREGGPAIECVDGTKQWFLNDKRHREGGPAIEYANGTKYWFLNGKLHRENGPAYEGADGTKFWYLNDEYLTEAQFNIRKHTCDGKVVEIDGKKYKLQEVK